MTLLRVRDLRIAAGSRPIVTGIDLDLAEGEALGIVGESGSGKSLSARSIIGLLPEGITATGSVRYRDRELLTAGPRERAAIRGREITMIFQDPFTMLNPLMRCGAQIVELLRDERGRRLGRKARRTEARTRLEEVGIDDPAVVDAFPFELSGGMRQRVGIAAALAQDPRLLIADEPSTALDVTTQREILRGLRELQASRGMGLILISHDLRVAFSMCDRITVLYAGSTLERAGTEQIEQEPQHPYTLGLLVSEPPADRRLSELSAIPGSVPSPTEVAGGCVFAPRCEWVEPKCVAAEPTLKAAADADDAHVTACIRYEEIAADMRDVRTAASARASAELTGRNGREPLVVVEGLLKTFGTPGTGRHVVALDDVGLEIAAGESVGLVGESGSGKTTLGRCLLGLERPSAGRIRIDGIEAGDYAKLRAAERRRLRRTIQMVFQDPYSTLNPARTVGATLAEALSVREEPSRTDHELGDLLRRVGLPAEYASRKPAALSGGERQRVAVARALAPGPRIIVCDEAVSSLDVSVQAQILNLLLAVHRETGVSLLFITHDLAVVRQVTDRTYVLRRGKLVESGATAQVLDQPRHPYTTELLRSVPRADGTWLAEVGEPSPVP